MSGCEVGLEPLSQRNFDLLRSAAALGCKTFSICFGFTGLFGG